MQIMFCWSIGKKLKDYTSDHHKQMYLNLTDLKKTLSELTGSISPDLEKERDYKTVKNIILINFISILKGGGVKSLGFRNPMTKYYIYT